jgi:hypothetical protein
LPENFTNEQQSRKLRAYDGNMELCDKNKGKVLPVDAMKAHKIRGTAPPILNLGTRWG